MHDMWRIIITGNPMKRILMALALGIIAVAAPAAGQQTADSNQSTAGTRLDLSVTGEVNRVPDLAIINAGVVTRSANAATAIQENAARMNQVIAALKHAGIAERDIQTSSINLNAEYRYPDNQPPQLTGYTATDQLTIRFLDIRSSGKILDALVTQGVNQISGPNLTLQRPDEALDEARSKAVIIGRARADLYARSLGMHVVRVVSVSENGGYAPPPPAPPMPMMARAEAAKTPVEPGEQQIQVTLSMVFELR
jgi:uncharacterized protein